MTDVDRFSQFVLPGRPLALAWLAVCLACGQDKDRPVLYRRVNIAVHDDGVILAATDGLWLARAWVPFEYDATVYPAPELDEAIPFQFTVADVDYRVRDLMRYIERRTRKIEDDDYTGPPTDVAITRFQDVDDDAPPLDPSLAAPSVLVELPGEERITVRESEIEYPNLNAVARYQPKPANRLLFAPQLMALAATAVQRFGAPALRITPTSQGSVAWAAEGNTAVLHGILMPLRDDNTEDEP